MLPPRSARSIELGRGGMGTVYLAGRADDTYRKRVAIRLISRGMDTEDVLSRFRNDWCPPA